MLSKNSPEIKSSSGVTTGFSLIAISSCLAVMFLTKEPLVFIVALEGYNLCYELLLYITKVNISSVKRLIQLSMLVFAIIAFGLCILQLKKLDYIGKLLIIIGFLFKLGTVPFHSWIIDIYGNSPFGIIAVTDGVFKVILTAIFINFLPILNINYTQLIHILGYMSLAVGSFLALKENNIKKWLGNLSIGHIGVVLCTISTNPTNLSIAGLIYLFASGSCTAVLCLAKNNIFRVIVIFAMLGLPPFHTFFAKVNLIEELLRQHCAYALLAIITYYIIELISAVRYIKRFTMIARN